jgi:RNA-dependent RNA polymerase
VILSLTWYASFFVRLRYDRWGWLYQQAGVVANAIQVRVGCISDGHSVQACGKQSMCDVNNRNLPAHGFLKGLLHVQPNVHDDAQEHPVARLRPSQVKIEYSPDEEPDPATLTLDLLCSSHMRVPSRLSHEILINLAENKVNHTVFVKLFKEGLSDNIDPYMKWDDAVQLWRTCAHRGGVLSSRRAREAGGESRAKGYGERETDDIEFEDEDGLRMENAVRQKSTAWWWDELSGCPSSIEETVMVLLDAGFSPTTCAVLRDKLKKSLNTQLDTYTKKCRVDVPMSCTAFIIPGESLFFFWGGGYQRIFFF